MAGRISTPRQNDQPNVLDFHRDVGPKLGKEVLSLSGLMNKS